MDRALIDTDILSYYFKDDPNVRSNFHIYLDHYDVIEVSIITYYEVTSGLLAKTLVTNNDKHFGRIPGIKLGNRKKYLL